MYLYYNNSLVEDLHLNPFCQGFQYGYGVFETILLAQGIPCFVNEHYERMQKACGVLGLDMNIAMDSVRQQAKKLSQAQLITEGRIKLICFRDIEGVSMAMTLTPFQRELYLEKKAVTLGVSKIRRNPSSPMCFIKSLNYAENILAHETVKRSGYQEALFLNNNQKLCEAAMSNIFWVKNNTVYTPDIGCGLLDGITRGQIIEVCHRLNIKVLQGSYGLEELLQADEVFATNSLRGVIPISQVDNTAYNISQYKLVRLLNVEYSKLIEQEIKSLSNV